MPNCYTCNSELNEWSESKGQIGQCRYCYAHYKRALHATNPIARLKQLARGHARKALNLGLIFKHNCTCGREESEMHHPDYSKPLEVVWQCKACHSAFHAIERRALNWLETKTPLSVKKKGVSHWQKRLLTKTSPQR